MRPKHTRTLNVKIMANRKVANSGFSCDVNRLNIRLCFFTFSFSIAFYSSPSSADALFDYYNYFQIVSGGRQFIVLWIGIF